MKIIIGLGNPGKKYEDTRHNAGFLAVALFAQKQGWIFQKKLKTESKTAEATINDKKIILVEPQTFMNNSGEAVKKICGQYRDRLDLSKDLLIVHDDVDLNFGELRLSRNSSSAGHKGVQNIIDNLGTQDFYRLRIGVESRQNKKIPSTENYVLNHFTEGEFSALAKILEQTCEEIKKFIEK